MTAPSKAAMDAARRFNSKHGGCCDIALTKAFDAFAAAQSAELLEALARIAGGSDCAPAYSAEDAQHIACAAIAKARSATADQRGEG